MISLSFPKTETKNLNLDPYILICFNFIIFVEHENIGFDDLWVDGTYLLNSGKPMLDSNVVSEVNKYFGKSDNFLGSFMT